MIRYPYTYACTVALHRKLQAVRVYLHIDPDANFELNGVRVSGIPVFIEVEQMGELYSPPDFHFVVFPAWTFYPRQQVTVAVRIGRLGLWNRIKLFVGFRLRVRVFLDGQKVFHHPPTGGEV